MLVINKAAGVVVHPSPGHETGTLVNAVLHHCRLPTMQLVPGQLPPASLDAGWGSGMPKPTEIGLNNWHSLIPKKILVAGEDIHCPVSTMIMCSTWNLWQARSQASAVAAHSIG